MVYGGGSRSNSSTPVTVDGDRRIISQCEFRAIDAEVILGRLPERIKVALIARAAEIEYPIAATIEMAIALLVFQGLWRSSPSTIRSS